MRRVLRRVTGGGDSNYGWRRGLEVQPGTANNVLRNRRRRGEGGGGNIKDALPARINPVSYTHLTLPTIYSV